jgi:hypothetical protein
MLLNIPQTKDSGKNNHGVMNQQLSQTFRESVQGLLEDLFDPNPKILQVHLWLCNFCSICT